MREGPKAYRCPCDVLSLIYRSLTYRSLTYRSLLVLSLPIRYGTSGEP